jgi:hypothetical protein
LPFNGRRAALPAFWSDPPRSRAPGECVEPGTGEGGQRRCAAGHRHDQREHPPGHLRPVAGRPVRVGGTQTQTGDSPLRPDQYVGAPVKPRACARALRSGTGGRWTGATECRCCARRSPRATSQPGRVARSWRPRTGGTARAPPPASRGTARARRDGTSRRTSIWIWPCSRQTAAGSSRPSPSCARASPGRSTAHRATACPGLPRQSLEVVGERGALCVDDGPWAGRGHDKLLSVHRHRGSRTAGASRGRDRHRQPYSARNAASRR